MNTKDKRRFLKDGFFPDFDPFGDEVTYEDIYGRTYRKYQTNNRNFRQPLDRNPSDPKDRAHRCVGDKKNVRIPSCHYTDERFKHPQTVFGRSVSGKRLYTYAYEDRFRDWNYELWREAEKHAREYSRLPSTEWEHGSARYWEMVLSHFHQNVRYKVDPVTLTETKLDVNVKLAHVMTGFNWSNGQSYYIFGYRIMGKDRQKVTS